MLSNTVADPTDDSTLQPNKKPIYRTRTCFQPIEIHPRDIAIDLPSSISADDPFSLFRLYYTDSIIQSIVEATNSYVRQLDEEGKLPCRAQDWTPTSLPEMYNYLAIRIYMTLHTVNKISDY